MVLSGSCPGGNCPRGSCPMGVIVLRGSCPRVVVPRVVVLGVVVPGVVVLEPYIMCVCVCVCVCGNVFIHTLIHHLEHPGYFVTGLLLMGTSVQSEHVLTII